LGPMREPCDAVYNSVGYCKAEFDALLCNFDQCIANECHAGSCSASHKVTTDDVMCSIGQLKYRKHDGHLGHYSDHIKNGNDRLNVMLSLLFTTMLRHGYTPKAMLVATISPIPKDIRKSKNDSNNYRSIALSSVIGKLFDWVLIKNNSEIFTSSNFQYAYKPKASTTQCSFVANETIQYYLNNNSSVHTILLDATKAFDRVQYVRLFKELRNKGLCPMVCKYLALQYSSQKCRVKWVDQVSDMFDASNGVKQGGVLSPLLFTVYMDCLLLRLKASHVGCHIGHVFSGAFAYADDIILLAPSTSSMDKLIQICEEFSLDFSITFNATKSKHIVFSKDKTHTHVTFCMQGKVIPTVEHDKHLGNIIGPNVLKLAIEDKVHELYKNTNLLMAQFSKSDIDVKYNLFKSYCMSVYGSHLWNFARKECKLFYTAWRKCIRRILGVPSNTHCNLLHLICEDYPVELQIHMRFINFFISCKASKCDNVRISALLACNRSRSSVSQSWSYVCKRWNIPHDAKSVKLDDIKTLAWSREKNCDLITAATIHDFLQMNEQCFDAQLSDLINELCTT